MTEVFGHGWIELPEPSYLKMLESVAKHEAWAVEHGLLSAKCAALTAEALGLPKEQVKWLAVAGLLHDVGKVTIDPNVFRNTAPLPSEDLDQIKRHVSAGARIAQGMHLPEEVVTAILHHHERVDGKGYPFGKSGDEIPLAYQAVALGELFSSLLTPRWYRPSLSPKQALTKLKDSVGKELGERVIQAFLTKVHLLFGLPSVSSVEECTQPFPIKSLALDEMALVWQATYTFISKFFEEAERFFGRRLCLSLANQLNDWLDHQRIPLRFSKTELNNHYQWWQTVTEEEQGCKSLLATILTLWGNMLGKQFLVQWLDGISQQLPDHLLVAGRRHGLWLWQD